MIAQCLALDLFLEDGSTATSRHRHTSSSAPIFVNISSLKYEPEYVIEYYVIDCWRDVTETSDDESEARMRVLQSRGSAVQYYEETDEEKGSPVRQQKERKGVLSFTRLKWLLTLIS